MSYYKNIYQPNTYTEPCESCVVYVVSYKHRYIWCYWNFFKRKTNNATKMATWFCKTSSKELILSGEFFFFTMFLAKSFNNTTLSLTQLYQDMS